MGNMLNGIPVIGSMTDTSGDQAIAELAKNQQIYQGLNVPQETWTNYAPQTMDPKQAQATQIQDDPNLRTAQMSALSKMADLSNTGLSAVDAQGYQNARDMGNQMANSGTQAAIQNAQARGIGGSGMEFAQREIANQQGAARSQQAGLQQAADSARQRALYNQAYSGALGQQRSQDFSNNAANAGILNNFNMANTNTQNQAQQYNVGNANQAQLINQQGRTGIQQANFQNNLSKDNAMAGANQGAAQGYAAQNAANTANQNSLLGAGIMAGSLYGKYGGNGAKTQDNPSTPTDGFTY